MMNESEQRALVVAEARRWLGTPYHNCADVRGAGVDCGMLIVRVFIDTGLCPPFDPRPYPPDWHLHRGEERYLGFVFDRCVEVAGPQVGEADRAIESPHVARSTVGHIESPHVARSAAGHIKTPQVGEADRATQKVQPGDVMVFRYGRCYSHGGIVTALDPLRIVHAYHPARRVLEQEVARDPELADRRRAPRFFSHWVTR